MPYYTKHFTYKLCSIFAIKNLSFLQLQLSFTSAPRRTSRFCQSSNYFSLASNFIDGETMYRNFIYVEIIVYCLHMRKVLPSNILDHFDHSFNKNRQELQSWNTSDLNFCPIEFFQIFRLRYMHDVDLFTVERYL